ncbi:MAG: response regulator [Chloroflexi bacterium]|nr:response regulator [Chloroflexota bacterium]
MKSTILLIEDDPGAARLAELILNSKGYQIVIASNGLQGLKLAQANPPDMILLDLMLPGQDGFEVLNLLRAEPRTADVPVIIVSSKSQLTDKQTATKIGADAYLAKPYKQAELLDLVHSLLRERPKKAAARGNCVLLVGSHGGEVTSVALYVGLALAGRGETTTVVDMRPFSVEHPLVLGAAPRLAPASLSDPETVRQLSGLTVQHPGGLRLLNNLEGNGEAGQITPEDAGAVLDVLLAEGGFVLVDLPLYPASVLHRVADRCALVLLVTQGDPASLRRARSALTLMERADVEMERIGIVFIGSPTEEGPAELGREVLGTVPAEAGPDDPAFYALADRLRSLKQPPAEGDVHDAI